MHMICDVLVSFCDIRRQDSIILESIWLGKNLYSAERVTNYFFPGRERLYIFNVHLLKLLLSTFESALANWSHIHIHIETKSHTSLTNTFVMKIKSWPKKMYCPKFRTIKLPVIWYVIDVFFISHRWETSMPNSWHVSVHHRRGNIQSSAQTKQANHR